MMNFQLLKADFSNLMSPLMFWCGKVGVEALVSKKRVVIGLF